MADINYEKARIPGAEYGIEVKYSVCDICTPGSHCGLTCYVKDGKVIKVEGTKEHVYNKGKLCTKGRGNRQYLYRPDRLLTPMKRVGKRGEGKFEPISWEKAIDTIAEKLLRSREKYGADSVAFYSGYTKWYRFMFRCFAHVFGTQNLPAALPAVFWPGRLLQKAI